MERAFVIIMKDKIYDNENVKVLSDVIQDFLDDLERDRDEILQECSIYSNTDLNALVDNFTKYDCDYNGYDWYELFVDFMELELSKPSSIIDVVEINLTNVHMMKKFTDEENRLKARMEFIEKAKENKFKKFCVWELKKLLITIAHDEYTIH